MDARCWLVDLSSDLGLDEVLNRIIENALGTFPSRDFALVLADADGGPDCVRSSGTGPGGRRRLAEWVSASGAFEEPQLVADLGSDQRLERLAMRAHGRGFQAICSQPLSRREGALGALVSLATETDAFDDEEREVLGDFSHQAAIALDNALTFQKLVEQATEDALTGLPNRRELDALLRRELERATRYGNVFSLAMLDLDGFKSVNDEHGHVEGDRLLREVAATIEETARTADLAARFGGDEFALILPQTDQFQAAAFCERLRVQVEKLGPVSLSWGVAEYPTHGTRRDQLLHAADAAMYASKPKSASSAEIPTVG